MVLIEEDAGLNYSTYHQLLRSKGLSLIWYSEATFDKRGGGGVFHSAWRLGGSQGLPSCAEYQAHARIPSRWLKCRAFPQ